MTVLVFFGFWNLSWDTFTRKVKKINKKLEEKVGEGSKPVSRTHGDEDRKLRWVRHATYLFRGFKRTKRKKYPRPRKIQQEKALILLHIFFPFFLRVALSKPEVGTRDRHTMSNIFTN